MREATIHLPDESLEALGIGEFVSTVRTHELQSVTELKCGRPGCILVVRTGEQIPPEELDGLPDIVWWEQLTTEESETYLCKVAVPALDEDLDPSSETAVSEPEVTPTEAGIDITVVGKQEALSDRVSDYEDVAKVGLRSLGTYEGPNEALDALTERQREVLEVARDLGYFEVPRAVTTEEMAAELEVSPSTVREHLQRAQRNVVYAVLGPRHGETE